MSIDEAIAHAREVASEQKRRSGICVQNNSECDKFSACLKCSEEHEQLAEWLEELKMLRELKDEHRKIGNIEGFNKGYDKAIDDFVEKLKSECREHYIDCDPYFGGITDSILYEDDIEEIAEQLKAGENNVNPKSES